VTAVPSELRHGVGPVGAFRPLTHMMNVTMASGDLFGTPRRACLAQLTTASRETLVVILLSSREVGISTMRLTLVQTSHEDKRKSRSETMATEDYMQLKVFSLVFLMLKGGRRIGVC
jgi:hypothetical protein